jgi:subtilisin family serine protease
MSRNLFITIHEAGDRPPRSAAARRAAGYDPEANYVLPPPSDPEANYVLPPASDPEANYVLPPVSDPEANYVLPPVSDPEANYVLPPPSDPTQGAFYASVYPGAPAAAHAWAGAAPACCCGAPAGSAKGQTAAAPAPFPPRAYSGFVIVRLAPGVDSSAVESLWQLATGTPGLPALKAALEVAFAEGKEEDEEPGAGAVTAEVTAAGADRGAPARHGAGRPPTPEPPRVLVSRPLVDVTVRGAYGTRHWSREQVVAAIRNLEAEAAGTPFPPLHSLTAYWRVDLRPYPDRVEEVVARLNRLAEVDLAYRELLATDSQYAGPVAGTALQEDQGYLDDAPAGIGAWWAWKSLGTTPHRLTVCDLEQGWNLAHPDLAQLQPAPALYYGANRATDEQTPGDHGTAVLGQLAAAGANPLSVKGAAHEVARFVLASHYRGLDAKDFPGTNGHVAAAVVSALLGPAGDPSQLGAGDVLLLEVQRALLPTEFDPADLEAVRLAAAHGVVVVEAAGNGAVDLDRLRNPDDGRTFRRGDAAFRDSGAVFVGAARAAVPHDRAPFSNYGSRVDCFGWGETVTTCGYGDLAGQYTNRFSGTSSAAPIVAGAAALLQSLHKGSSDELLEPLAMRALLADPSTGTRQGANVGGHIGVMPDLCAIVRDQLQLVADVYLRRRVGDDGSRPGPEDEVSSSPDILLGPATLAEAETDYGEGSPLENQNHPTPGLAPKASASHHLYVRLRNRGTGPGRASVQLFATPAATLVTPERWTPVGALPAVDPKKPVTVAVPEVPQGDRLTLAGPVAWTPPTGQLPAGTPWVEAPAWSLLAVVDREGGAPPSWAHALPPGGPYFDWAAFRAFLRRPGVAWRNAHRVAVPPPGNELTLAFYLAGTPDHARHFDFEVVQRLPAKVKVGFLLPDGLAAKVQQRQPWLGDLTPLVPPVPGWSRLAIPQRPRTAFRQVRLPAGSLVEAAFRLSPASGLPAKGHSLAIRQLWRGEEVGRITWWFG